jgi:hypothetical protein
MKTIKQNRPEESGQTMIFAVFAVIILLFAALFIFDLQSVIRLKVKSQTAADSAALAAAEIQRESLNLIGEINIVKACTVLITDFSDDASPQSLIDASDTLTEIQTRISFAGPLLALGAAEQAAKNNGMVDPAEVYSGADYNVFSLSSYISNVEDDEIYGSDEYPQTIQGYEWRTPYIEMLRAINNEGIAAGPNMIMPHMNSSYSLDMINAVLSNYWCQDDLRELIKNDENFEEQWWNGIISDAGFAKESEVLPLHIQMTGNDKKGSYYSKYLEQAHYSILKHAKDNGLEMGMLTQMPYMKWCLYDATWTFTASGSWSDEYLRRPLRKEYTYGGAAAKMTCLVPGGADSKFTWLSGAYRINSLQNRNGIISKKSNSAPDIRSSAAAKPLGYLTALNGERYPPNTIAMILPTFQAVRLVPVAMVNVTTIYDEEYLLYKFFKWLEGVNDLDNPRTPPPAGTQKYLAAFKKLNDPTWRHSGYNPEFTYTPPGPVPSYDPATDTGAGYLQEPAEDPSCTENCNGGYETDTDGNIIGISYTNEDLCNWNPHGDKPSDKSGGGPGVLH